MNRFQLLLSVLVLSLSGIVHASAALNKMENVMANSNQANSLTVNNASRYSPNLNSDKTSTSYSIEGRRMSHVPEPEGWAMMVLGVGFVIFQVRRRRRARESWDLR